LAVNFVAMLFTGLARCPGAEDDPLVTIPQPVDLSPEKLAEERELIRLLADTLEQVRANYVDRNVSERELVDAAIHGMITQLDPYSEYIDPSNLAQFQKALEGEFVGIGVQVSVQDNELVIVAPLFGTPAWRAGLRAGDRIIRIGDTNTSGMSTRDAVKLMTGLAGTSVEIAVQRPDQFEPRIVTLQRDVIQPSTVLGYRRDANGTWDFMCDEANRLGYIRVTLFNRNTTADLRDTLQKLQAEQIRGVVLDLRFNPGGMLKQAIETSDLFLHEGRIVSVSGRAVAEQVWDAIEPGTVVPRGFPIAVLVNRFSASAAEIVAACLQDHHLAVVVGERTWGKGSVQNVIKMEQGKSLLKLTTAVYLRPSGKNIHRSQQASESDDWGVQPDEGFEVKFSDDELRNLVAQFDRRDALFDRSTAESQDKSLGDAGAEPSDAGQGGASSDRQLEKSLEYLRQRIQAVADGPVKDPTVGAARM
jgi:carboxyl-terminal processing protease